MSARPGCRPFLPLVLTWMRLCSAPGSAPVYHPCGMAGGGPAGVYRGKGGEAEYTNTSIAKQGDLGSVLPPAPSGTVFKRGSEVEVGWSIRANVSEPRPLLLWIGADCQRA